MRKETTLKDDGRYLIYYTFDEEDAPPAPSGAAAFEPPSGRGGAGEDSPAFASFSPSPQAGERGPGGEGKREAT